VDPVLLKSLNAGVLELVFNRAERNNTWNRDLEEDYFAALANGARDPNVRVIVVTASGRFFCPGVDLQVVAHTEGEAAPAWERLPATFARRVPKPVIAAVNGACPGVGLVQACAADIRFAARGAKITTGFARRGLPAGELAVMAPSTTDRYGTGDGPADVVKGPAG
jgi:enoyl-CoA hydratase/carnithine racemase